MGAFAACVSEEGIAGFTFRNVAKRAGATTGMLTHYYHSKDAIVRDASVEAERTLRARVFDRAGTRHDANWLRAFFTESFHPTEPDTLPWIFWIEYWSYAVREPRLASDFNRRTQRLHADFSKCIENEKKAGRFRADLSTARAADILIAVLQGSGLNSALQGSTPATTEIGAILDEVLEGFKVPLTGQQT